MLAATATGVSTVRRPNNPSLSLRIHSCPFWPSQPTANGAHARVYSVQIIFVPIGFAAAPVPVPPLATRHPRTAFSGGEIINIIVLC